MAAVKATNSRCVSETWACLFSAAEASSLAAAQMNSLVEMPVSAAAHESMYLSDAFNLTVNRVFALMVTLVYDVDVNGYCYLLPDRPDQ